MVSINTYFYIVERTQFRDNVLIITLHKNKVVLPPSVILKKLAHARYGTIKE